MHGITSRNALTAFAVFSVLLMLSMSGKAINNCDWGRVTQFGGFTPECWKATAESYVFSADARLEHSTTMGVLVALISLALRGLGADAYSQAVSSGVLYCIFLIGIVFVTREVTKLKSALYVVMFLLIALLFGFYFESFYEEASVIAFTPLLVAGYYRVLNKKSASMYLLSACAIIYSKIQMVYFAPLFVIPLLAAVGETGKWSPVRKSVAVGMLVLTAIMAAHSVHVSNKFANQYNRYYNGIGWSLLEAYKWPGSEFRARHHFFYENKEALQSRLPPSDQRELMGTSFWPTGYDMAKTALADAKDNAANVDESGAAFEKILDRGAGPSYLRTILSEPKVFYALLVNAHGITLSSDYSLNYIRKASDAPGAFIGFLETLRHSVLANFGIFVALFVSVLVLRNFSMWFVAVVAIFAGSPVVVVMGDGFFEMEKHLVPYFSLLPVLLAYSDCRGAQAGDRRAKQTGELEEQLGMPEALLKGQRLSKT